MPQKQGISQKVAIGDPTNPDNVLKPNSDGSINVVGGGGSLSATASATPTPVVAGPNKPLNIDLFSSEFVTITDGNGNIVNQSATVNVAPDTSVIFNGSTALTPLFAAIAASSNGANQIVAAVAAKKIRVVAYTLVASASVNAKWQSAANDKTGLLYLAANGGATPAYCPVGLFETNAGEALNLNLSGAVPVGGHITYITV